MSESGDFGAKLGGIVDQSFLCITIAIGNELGLFKLLATGSKESGMNSATIAKSLGLKERYVREWIGAVFTGGIIDRCTEDNMFYLSPEKARHLFSPTCLWADLLVILAGAYNDIAEAFRQDGPEGVPYSRYPRFHAWRQQITKLQFPSLIEDSLIPACPEIWEAARGADGISVCEVGCSEGVLTSLLAKKFPSSHFWASDICPDAIANANKTKAQEDVTNVTYEVQDATALPTAWSERFDLVVVVDVIHDLGRPDLGVQEIHRILKPGGRAIITDIACHSKMEDNGPEGSSVYTISLFHCMPVSLNEPGGWGLGAAWGVERAEKLFLDSGFSSVDVKGGGVFVCSK